MSIEALVFDIERFALQDGPGIRTVVFLKGCPLHCLWCHNPESCSFKQEIFFSPEKCIGCGACVAACPQSCHLLQDGTHFFERENCSACGRCAVACPVSALEVVGKRMSIPAVLEEIARDKAFYENSGGGVTISGGEPLAHFEFTEALLVACKEAGFHTCVETSGYGDPEKIKSLLPLVDLWLWDNKATTAEHARLTGVENDLILRNLRLIDAQGAKTWLRCPLIPGVNDSLEHLSQIAELANSLVGCQRIDLEPYHPLGEEKSRRLGRKEVFNGEFVDKAKVEEYKCLLADRTKVPIHQP